MKPREVRVRVASLNVVADDAAGAVSFLRLAEQALVAALDGLGDALGDEVLLIRKLDLREGALLSGTSASVGELRSALRAHLDREIDEARLKASEGKAGRDVAWYPSEAAAVGDYLRALGDGSAGAWPQRALADWGGDIGQVLRAAAARGAAFAGDVLAEVARRASVARLAERIDRGLAAALVALWTGPAPPGGAVAAWAAFPPEVREAVAARLRADLGDGAAGPHGELVLLAHLFAAWPPARGARFAPHDLASALDAAKRADAGAGPGARLPSRAGGLCFWARVLADCGLEHALGETYPEARQRRAVRWALGRALEIASVDARDPLLLAWAGEQPGVAAFPSSALDGADPEPLHRAALLLASRLGYLEASLRAAPFGGGVAAVTERGLVVDWLAGAGDVHDAIPEIAGRFARRAARPPASIEVADRLPTADLDAIADVDVPAVPDPWRPALWAAASLARAAAADRWRVRIADARGWPATLVAAPGGGWGDGQSVELARGNVNGIAAGAWLASPSIALGENQWRIVVR